MRLWGSGSIAAVLILGSVACSAGDDTNTSATNTADPTTAGIVVTDATVAPSTTETTSVATTVAETTTTSAAPGVAFDPEGVGTVTITGPITGGAGAIALGSGSIDLAAVGYVEEEYFVSGTASAYRSGEPLSVDGAWTVEAFDPQPFTTRVIVRRPADPADFGGDVAVEWMNVSAGFDSSPDWSATHAELTRSGWAWIGVSAQKAGLEGSERALVPLAPKVADPVRYADLNHPGDSYSFDMYSQVGAAVRTQFASLLGGAEPAFVYAFGESQSAFRLVTYIDAVAATANVFDGYLVHSRGGAGAALTQEPHPLVDVPEGLQIRTDLAVPVFQFQTETDVFGGLDFLVARQPDTDLIRTWEVAGTAHADTYTLGIADTDDGSGAADLAVFDTLVSPPSGLYSGIITCDAPINAGGQTYVLRAAVDGLRTWVRDGVGPPSMPVIDTAADGTSVRDADGNVTGGVRTPHVDAPIATLSGLGQTGGSFCGLFGTTTPFAPSMLAERYGSRAGFIEAWNAATDAAVTSGVVLPDDAERMKGAAAASTALPLN